MRAATALRFFRSWCMQRAERTSTLHGQLQFQQRVIPLLGNQLQRAPGLFELCGFEFPQALAPDLYVVHQPGASVGQFISSDGHCQSFGEGGDGYIPAEGVGVVILKRLSQAQRDGDHIYAIIRGSAVNHGGKTNGYTVPNLQAQAAVIGEVLLESRVDPRRISYIEAHGTGTKLGDPIEIAALSKAFQRSTQDSGFCLIGSAKSNIGHAESAAGIAGLTKVLLQMKHRQIAPSLHSQRLNPHIEFQHTPFVVNQQLVPWPQPVIDGREYPRIAGISSFGAGGANAHLIVEEYVEEEAGDRSASTQPVEMLVPLSARTAEQLQLKVQDLLAFIAKGAPVDLGSLAYTLQTGREALPERLGLIVRSIHELVAGLQAHLQGSGPGGTGIFRGRAGEHRDALSMITADADFEVTVARWIERRKLDQLLGVWVQGFNVDWNRLWSEHRPHRISLPTYPFARERYWNTGPVFIQASAPVAAAGTTNEAPHAVPHRATEELPTSTSSRSAALEARPAVRREALPPSAGLERELSATSSATLAKPSGISLIEPGPGTLAARSIERRVVRLGALEPLAPLPSNDAVRLQDRGNGVLQLDIDAAGSGHVLSSSLIEQLLITLAQAAKLQTAKVLVIAGTAQHFLGGDRQSCDEAIERGLYRAIASFPVPVIAAAAGDAFGAGLLAAALCDFMIVNREGRYAYTLPQAGLYPAAEEFLLFGERFGESRAGQLLYVSPSMNGASLGCTVLPGDEIPAYTDKLAATLASMPRKSLELLKAHLSRGLRDRVDALRPMGSQARRSPHDTVVPAAPGRFVGLEVLPHGVLQVTVRAVRNAGEAQLLMTELGEVFAGIGKTSGCRCVVVSETSFFDGLDRAVTDDSVLELRRQLLALPVPVIGALPVGASGAGWLISQYFDVCVYAEDSFSSLAQLQHRSRLSQEAAAVFPARFGASLGGEIVLTGRRYSGMDLQRRAAGVQLAKSGQVLARALEIASSWNAFPFEALRAWKACRISSLESVSPPVAAEPDSVATEPSRPGAVVLASDVIQATAHPDGILVVTMQDRQAKNRFSAAFIDGMNEVFRHIAATPAYKVVVLTGYDTYFASGGTREALLAIQDGRLKYTDAAVFELPLRCRIPVIAAVQGHTFGAGWSLGLFCDLQVCAEESTYSTRFMSFGFTPGAASTLVFPRKLGRDLSVELLMTASETAGRELHERGMEIPVLPRKEVLPAAMQMAQLLARRDRSDLIALKRQLSGPITSQLDATYRYELDMQQQTFVGQQDVLERIRASYMQEEGSPMNVSAVADTSAGLRKQQIADRLAEVTASIGKLLAEELYLREDEIEPHTQFVDMGLDSITGVTWIRKINEKHALAIEATKVYSHPTLAELGRHVWEELARREGSGVAAEPEAAPQFDAPASPAPVQAPVNELRQASAPVAPLHEAADAVVSSGPIAVVGMAGQFPKAENLQAFWNNLAGGVDCIGVIPAERWDVGACYQEGAATPGKTLCKWMGALERYDEFDPLFFAISPTEAQSMDPQQRLFLQACWHAIEDAGYGARSLSGSRTGVFAGCAAGDYYRDPGTQRLSAQQLMGSAPSILPARISYFLNLQGPCVSVDTACSSSLVALATACDSLSCGASDVALAGGVQVMAGPAMHIMTSQAGMLSPDGRCFSFDERANGFVPAEAVGVVMLKRLADAQRDGDSIYGVIRGWGVNQDGRTNGITAPNPESQTRLEQSVYDRYRIDPEHIQLIEAHGTGTRLGDPIEIEGLKAAFAKYTHKAGYCAVGSVKSNMGHALNAAGVSGFIKLMLALQHRQLPPTLHCRHLNQHIALEGSPFFINGELRDWPLNGAPLRQAAISSFGFSGTNCHMVVAEAPPLMPEQRPISIVLQDGAMAVPVSARTEEQLRQRIVDLLAFVRARCADESAAQLRLQDLAYTLQTGRDPMDHRLGVMANSLAQLVDRLQGYLDRGDAADGCCRGQVKQNKEGLRVITQDEIVRETIIEKYLSRGAVDKLLQLWTKGLDVDWNRLYGEHKPRRIALPVYPFARQRYWLEADLPAANLAANSSAQGSSLHPLLQRNTSNFTEQRYDTELTGHEPFLADHRVAGKKILPGVAHLEMARAAIADATGAGGLMLRNVVWSRPVIVAAASQTVRIVLHPEGPQDIEYQIVGADDASQRTVFSSGRATLGRQVAGDQVDIAQVQARASHRRVDAEAYYGTLAASGLQYGESHRRIVELSVGEGEVLARLAPQLSSGQRDTGYILNPGLLDAAFHASLAMQDAASPLPLLPFALERLEICGDCNDCTWAWIRVADDVAAAGKLRKLDIDLCDANGSVRVRVRGLSSRPLEQGQSEATDAAQTLMLEPVWVEQAATADAAASEPVERVLFLCGFEAVAPALQRYMPEATVISARGCSEAALAERFHTQAVQLFDCLQRLLVQKPERPALVQVLVSARDEGEIDAGLWSLLQSAHLESSKIVGQVIAIDPAAAAAEVQAKLEENRHSVPVGSIRYERGRRLVRQLAELTLPTAADSPWRDGGIYLITGGAGGLGMIFARAIVASTTNATVVLTGRSALNERGRQRIQELQGGTARVQYRQVDVTDAAAVHALLQGLHEEHGHLNGILHCAGVIRDNYIARKSTADFETVLAPKVAGTCHLDAASGSVALDFFVLFSSIGGVLGGAGQSDYAAANAFMDAYAAHRNRLVRDGQRSGLTLSINWPLWQSEGMGVDAAKEAFFKAHFGMLAMPEARGLQAFDRALRSGKAQVMVMDGIAQRMRQRLMPAKLKIESQPPGIAPSPQAAAVLDEQTLLTRVQETVRRKVARFLKIRDEELDLDTELREFGFDSISLTEFTNQLNQDLKLDLTPTVFFEYPTLSALASHLLTASREVFVAMFEPRATVTATTAGDAEMPTVQPLPRIDEGKTRRRFSAAAVAPTLEQDDDPVAIVGISGRFPQAASLEEFWENLRSGRDCITEVPASRWDWRALYGDPQTEGNRTNIKWGGFIDGVDEFDPLFFGISPREAQLMDPQQRLLMIYAWKAIEAAGHAPESLSGAPVGIFVGTYTSGYQELAAQAGVAIDGYSSTGMSTSIGPNRMSYFLNLHGPSEPIETACSSSLVAIHRAVAAIQAGSCEAAIAGGVNTIVSPRNHIAFSKAGMLCEDGRCKTFSDRANGYVRGEGVGMLLLKKLSAAERDGDQIHAVIRSSAENHGGRASSLTAPNPKAQASLLQSAYRQAGVDPRTIGYIEAHGTGTELGDPIEIDALKSAFQNLYADMPQDAASSAADAVHAHCGLGSLKSNIGHLELAAGVAGVIKVLLQMKHGTRVRTLHCDTINPYIDLAGTPFYIARENDTWQRLKDAAGHELPRRAGVSSFGFGGVNAHVVLEEYVADRNVATQAETRGPWLIVLSAKTETSLQQAVDNLAQYLEGEGRGIDLARIAYTLQVGRNAMEQRLAMVVHSREELLDKLRRFASGGDSDDLYRGEIKRGQEALSVFAGDEDLQGAIEVWIQKGKYDRLLGLWVKGLTFDWNRLYGAQRPMRVTLPTYAFATERVWIESPVGRPESNAPRPQDRAVLHPLLHLNTSTLDRQSYRTTLTGDEFFLQDHRVRTGAQVEAVLPAVAYLEMARAALQQALPEQYQETLELCGTTWQTPCIVTTPRELTLALHADAADDAIDFEIFSHSAGEAVVHCQGRLVSGSAATAGKFDVEQLRTRMTGPVFQPEKIYAALADMGLHYGPAHRALSVLHVGEGELLARLELPVMLEATRDAYLLHPSLMDGALQASIGLLLARGNAPAQPWVPFALESLSVLGPCPQEMYAWLRHSGADEGRDSLLKLDIDLFDRDGNPCASLSGFSARALQSDATGLTFDDGLYQDIIDSVMSNRISIEEAAALG